MVTGGMDVAGHEHAPAFGHQQQDKTSATKETTMKAHVQGWGRKTGQMTWLAGAVFAFMAVNDDNGCAPDVPAAGNRGECQVASDCQGDPGIDCTGAWACNSGTCAFECGATPIETGCYGDSDCSDGLVCNAAVVCHQPPGCGTGDAPCAAVCYGECVRPEPQPDKCTASAQCPVGEYCTTESGACDRNCGPNETCATVCWGDCKPRENGTICHGDNECQFGQFCDRDPCVFPDGDGQPASGDRIACGGVCADKEGCNGPNDCGPGEICGCAPYGGDAPANGLIPCHLQCQPAEGACNYDSDCKEGQVCQNGACTEIQRNCGADSECPVGWLCQSECNGGGATPGDSDFAAPPCEGMCVPQGGTCADTGEVCLPGETCVNECYTACPDCACAEGEPCDCGPCQEDCRSACVPTQGGCDPNTCPAGTHCGCPDWGPTPANGLVYCEEKCIDDKPPTECWGDTDCHSDQYCAPSDCTMPPAPCDDPSGHNCDAERPAPGCAGTCQPRQREYDCKTDENCISPDGQQGYCKLEVCEGFAVPCSSDDPNCGMPPPPVCYGYCTYETTVSCDPNADTCPDGTHCEEVGGCGSSGEGFMPCHIDYQCVPDVATCTSDCDCDPSLACNEGVCQRMGRINLCERRCETDCDCPEELACGGGNCVVMDRMNMCGHEGCTSDDQCHDGDYCNIDYSQPVCACAGCPCSIPHGTCEPKEIVACDGDADCGEGEVCGCGQDPNCPMCDVCFFQCMPKPDDGSCDTDTDCGSGQQCTFYYPPCAQPPEGSEIPPACNPIGVCEDLGCRVQGCSDQVCSDAADVITTCEYADYYQCYKYAICDYNTEGVCGWQKTDAYVLCMRDYNQPQ